MNKRKPPVEITGYRNRNIFVVDHVRGIEGFCWYSFVNDDDGEEDFLPWDGDSAVDDCPF